MTTVGTELRAIRYRPGPKIMMAVWCAQIIVFAYLVSYLIYRFVPSLSPAQAAQIHRALLPGQLATQVLDSMPVYGGPVMLIIGALVGGGDYRWGTLRTIIARYPDRTGFLLGRAGALTAVMLLISVVSLVLSGVCATIIALAGHDSAAWPSPGSLLAHLLALWLVCAAWGIAGFALAVLTRSVTAAIGIGLLWTLALENVVGALAASVPALSDVRKVLLSAATGSLAKAMSGPGAAAGAPGVAPVVAGWVAVLILLGYVAAGIGVGLAAFTRRDIT
jgi:ABC-type transport system involved in multi-copper enzyme maturation permease subunit